MSSSWTISGRVLPERCDVYVPKLTAHFADSSGDGSSSVGSVEFEVLRGHLVAIVRLNGGSPSIFELSSMVKSAMSQIVDFIAFRNRASYQVVLDTCLNNETGKSEAVPVFEPIFDGGETDHHTFIGTGKDGEPVELPLIPSPQLSAALHDLTQAVRHVHRTPTYCGLAVEAVRNHFDPNSKSLSWRERYRKGELAMCEALKLDRTKVRRLDSYAAPNRHGEQLVELNWIKRKEMLEFSWEVVNRFRLYLSGQGRDDWAVI